MQNVKRAINRYGTLPKGARIGAYLESLRQNGIDGDEAIGDSQPPVPSNILSMSKISCAQPGNMVRSNSSGGFQPNTNIPSLVRNRAVPPSLADLEFPPPPPPEELECEDVTNLQPSTEEASFRFGVNLRHREPSTDSCNSAKSEPAKKVNNRPRDQPPSPPDQVSLPPSPPDPPPEPVGGDSTNDAARIDDVELGEKVSINRNVYKNAIPGIMKEMMQLKLVNDNKERSNDDESASVDFKQNLRKPSDACKNESGGNRFRVQLKKVDVKKPAEESRMDVKSRLKKIDNVKIAAKEMTKTSNGELDVEEEDKRCSTGSINSLKKLWEGESPPEVSKERKVWPPEEKPVIATKPTSKSTNTMKQTTAIYATPGALANVLDIWQVLENNLASLKSSPNVSSASWLLLSDKVSSFHSSCLSYVDSAAPLHSKFHLRELLTKLESQARLLRTAGTRNQAENSKVLTELHNMLKDIINAVQK